MRISRLDDEQRRSAEDFRIRNDFECELARSVARARSRPPIDQTSALRIGVDLLKQEEYVASVAALQGVSDQSSAELTLANAKDRQLWQELLQTGVGRRASRSVLVRSAFRAPLPEESAICKASGSLLLIVPCMNSRPPASLAVVVDQADLQTALLRLTESAADQVDAQLVMLERQQGYRDMATRVAYMTSSSVLLAQFRLLDMKEKAREHAPSLLDDVDAALAALGDAQRGLDRARLLGLPPVVTAEHVQLYDVLTDVAGELNSLSGDTVVATDRLHLIEHGKGMFVFASPLRIRYAVRDIALCTWLLTKQDAEEKRAPTRFALRNGGDRAILRVAGGPASLPRGLSSQELPQYLQDPERFLLSTDQHVPERTMGLHLAWKLIGEVGGTLTPHLSEKERRLRFDAELPLADGNGRP